MANETFISALVKNQFPSFYHEEGPVFLEFIKAYYDWMEQSGKATDQIYTVRGNHDIDNALDEFIEYFRRDIIPSIPNSIVADKRLLAKHIKDFYQSRGTLSAYKLLFRILFNEDVEINYPSDQILKVSDGDWRIDRYLVTRHRDQNYQMIGQTITGLESGANALVEDVVRRVVRGRDVDQLLLSNINGFFTNGENVRPSNRTDDFIDPAVEAGIHRFEILSGGAEYQVGDEFEIISNKKGKYAKIIVTEVQDKKGVINFSVLDGGSGYTSTVSDFSAKSIINIEGGNGRTPASFEIYENDLSDKFSVTLCVTGFESNTIYGSLAPLVPYGNTMVQMSKVRYISFGAPDFGIPEAGIEVTGGVNFREHSNAVVAIANSNDIVVGDSIYGTTSGANGIIKMITDDTAGASVFVIDAFKKFQVGEDVAIAYANGDVVGTVDSFSGNTIGHHIVTVGNTGGTLIQEDDELVGLESGAFGVVKKIITINTGGYDDGQGDVRDLLYLTVTSNNDSSISNVFSVGPMKHFIENEGVRKVGETTLFGNVSTFTANSGYKNWYTPTADLMEFISTTVGSIDSLSEEIGGSGYSIAPTVKVIEPSIKALGIGEVYITLQNTSPNWGTGNSQITTIDSNDRLRQSATGARGNVKVRELQQNVPSSLTGREEIILRVWQDQQQRFPGGVNYELGSPVQIDFYDSASQENLVASGTAEVVAIDDRGILGDNADIGVQLGANGTITGLKVIDSGYSYEDGETVEIDNNEGDVDRRATGSITLYSVANSQGYYATTRSQISSKSGIIQDSRFYQEYSYEVVAPLALERYREIALSLVHPSGQALFGRYSSYDDVDTAVTVSAVANEKRVVSVANLAISNASSNVVFTSNVFSEYSNGDFLIIETSPKVFRKALLNIVNANGTFANITSTWNEGDIADANAYYVTGSIE